MCNNNETVETFAPLTPTDVVMLEQLIDAELAKHLAEDTIWNRENLESLKNKMNGYWEVVHGPLYKLNRDKVRLKKRVRNLERRLQKEQEAALQVS